MTDTNPLDILKSAILLEKRGKTFYQKAAEQSQNKAVKEFFEMMADEEVSHVHILSRQYKSYQKEGKFLDEGDQQPEENVAAAVLTEKLKKQMKAAGFEAAAISAAMAMEERAIRLYSQRAGETDDPQERTLYRWLADWEGQHLAWLSKIEREVTEAVWHDNSFWPF
jgi:rubrerythrin